MCISILAILFAFVQMHNQGNPEINKEKGVFSPSKYSFDFSAEAVIVS